MRGKKSVAMLKTCIPAESPCRLLFLKSESDEMAPFKFMEYVPDNKCCAPFQCKERDVAALSFFRNDFLAGTVENVGSISYCVPA